MAANKDRIRDYIVARPGTWLYPNQIAAGTGSFTRSVREVIREMVVAGMLETEGRGRGIWVMYTPKVPLAESQAARLASLEAALRLAQHKIAQVLAGQSNDRSRLEAALITATRALDNWEENVVGIGREGRLTPRDLLPHINERTEQ